MGVVPLKTPSRYISDPDGVEEISSDPVVSSSGDRYGGTTVVQPDTSTRAITKSRDNFLYMIR